jgi:hypothetical protein
MNVCVVEWLRFVLFEFRPNLALPNTLLNWERSPLKHSYGYASTGDRPSCLASFALLLEPFMNYAG